MSDRLKNVLGLVTEHPWAVLDSTFVTVQEVLAKHVEGGTIDASAYDERRDAYAAQRTRAAGMSGGGVAVLSLYGLIVPRANVMAEMSGATSADSFTQQIRATVADPNVAAIVIDVDSPGGITYGIPELAAEIRAAAQKKPVYMVANHLAASAAYWVASQATDLAVTPSGEVGALGTFMVHQEASALLAAAGIKTTVVKSGSSPFKAEELPFDPLTAEAHAAMQEKVDRIQSAFTADVAAGRGTGVADVRANFGQGRVVDAKAALASGMVDRIATLEQVVQLASRGNNGRRPSAAFGSVEIPVGASVIVDHEANLPVVVAAVAGPVAVAAEGFRETPYGLVRADDRRAEPVALEPTKEIEMEPDEQGTEQVPEAAATAVLEPATPRASDPARGELMAAVTELRETVVAMNAGRADQEKVDRLSQEVLELRTQLDSVTPRSGYRPGDGADLTPIEGSVLAASLEMPIPRAAAQLHRPEADVAEFREKSDNLLILAAAMRKDPRELAYYEQEFQPALAAMDTATTGEGADWVPTVMSSDLIARVELGLRVAALFRSLPMPSNPYDMPGVGLTRTRGGKAAQQTADTGQTGFKKITPGTRKVTLTAVKFAAEVLVSKEDEEDSLIPVIPFIRDEITSQLVFDVEDALVNGDVTGTHMDSDVTASDDPRKIWAGLRKLAAAAQKSDASGAVVTAALLRTQRKKMGKYGVDSTQLAHLVSIAGYVNLLGDANVVTVDKFGPDAVIHRGELAKVDGIPIIVSQFVRDDLNASGVYDGTTTTRTVALTVNTNGWVIGDRRGLTLQILRELYAEFDQDALAVSLRKAFSPLYTNATEGIVANLYNCLN